MSTRLIAQQRRKGRIRDHRLRPAARPFATVYTTDDGHCWPRWTRLSASSRDRRRRESCGACSTSSATSASNAWPRSRTATSTTCARRTYRRARTAFQKTRGAASPMPRKRGEGAAKHALDGTVSGPSRKAWGRSWPNRVARGCDADIGRSRQAATPPGVCTHGTRRAPVSRRVPMAPPVLHWSRCAGAEALTRTVWSAEGRKTTAATHFPIGWARVAAPVTICTALLLALGTIADNK